MSDRDVVDPAQRGGDDVLVAQGGQAFLLSAPHISDADVAARRPSPSAATWRRISRTARCSSRAALSFGPVDGTLPEAGFATVINDVSGFAFDLAPFVGDPEDARQGVSLTFQATDVPAGPWSIPMARSRRWVTKLGELRDRLSGRGWRRNALRGRHACDRRGRARGDADRRRPRRFALRQGGRDVFRFKQGDGTDVITDFASRPATT